MWTLSIQHRLLHIRDARFCAFHCGDLIKATQVLLTDHAESALFTLFISDKPFRLVEHQSQLTTPLQEHVYGLDGRTETSPPGREVALILLLNPQVVPLERVRLCGTNR